MLRILAPLLALAAAPALADGPNEHHHDHAAHLAEAGDLRLLHAWAVEGSDPLLIFVEIENTGAEDVTLTGIHGDWGDFDLVAPVLQNGEPVLVTLSELTIPAQSELHLEPGGAAIRALNLTEEAHEGHVEELDLHFTGDLEAEIDVEIMPRGTTKHPHAGHNH